MFKKIWPKNFGTEEPRSCAYIKVLTPPSLGFLGFGHPTRHGAWRPG